MAAVTDVEQKMHQAKEEASKQRQRADELAKRLQQQELVVKEAKEAATKAHLEQGLVQSMSAELIRLRDQLSSTQARLSSTATSADETLGEFCRVGEECALLIEPDISAPQWIILC